MPSDFQQAFIFGTGELALATIKFCADRGLKCHVFLGPRQIQATDDEGVTYLELFSCYTASVHVTDSISDHYGFIERDAGERTFAFSFGSPFIIRQNLIDIFQGRVFNMHNTPLPAWRGGASYSWMVLCGVRQGATTIHKIDAGIDTGDIVAQASYTFPPDCRLPQDYANHARRQAHPVLMDFLDRLLNGQVISAQEQDERLSSYFPRLHTETQSYIDWRWDGEAIKTFIWAFSHPYDGAQTFCSDALVNILDCRFEPDAASHPFTTGIITRSEYDGLTICVPGGRLIIAKSDVICDRPLAAGDRLYTPSSYLEQAMLFRPIYTASGLKRPNS